MAAIVGGRRQLPGTEVTSVIVVENHMREPSNMAKLPRSVLRLSIVCNNVSQTPFPKCRAIPRRTNGCVRSAYLPVRGPSPNCKGVGSNS